MERERREYEEKRQARVAARQAERQKRKEQEARRRARRRNLHIQKIKISQARHSLFPLSPPCLSYPLLLHSSLSLYLSLSCPPRCSNLLPHLFPVFRWR